MIDNPRSVSSFDDRLSALEDPSLAERLLAENPELYRSRLMEAAELEPIAPPEPKTLWQRFGRIAIVLIALASVVAGYVLFPLLSKRPAPQPQVRRTVAGAPPKPTGQHGKAVNPIGTAPHEDATLRAELVKQQREIEGLRANIAARAAAEREARAAAAALRAARPAALPVQRPATTTAVVAHPALKPAVKPALQPVQKYSDKPVWDVRPSSKAHAGTAAATSASVSTSTSVSTSSSTATSTSTATATGAQTAAQTDTVPQTVDAPMPDGTKGGPPSGGGVGHWTEHNPYGVVVGGGSGACSPSRDSMTSGIVGSILSHASGGRF